MTILAARTDSRAADEGGDRRRWIALVVVCLAMFMNALDGSIVNVALPDIQRSLHFSQAGLTWVVDAYLISFGSFLLMAGRLGDLVGRKKVFLTGVAVFTLASIACGSADSQAMLVGGAIRAGDRRRAVGLGDRRDHRHRIPELRRAGEGDERLRVRGGGRWLRRTPRGRGAHPGTQLALDLLRERADRHRDAALRHGPIWSRTSASAFDTASTSPDRSW